MPIFELTPYITVSWSWSWTRSEDGVPFSTDAMQNPSTYPNYDCVC